MSDNALATVFYPQARNYIVEFLNSVSSQSNKNFILVIFNNGLKEIYSYLEDFQINFKVIEINEPPAFARAKMINYIKKNFKSVIFSDCDDLLDKNRVDLSLKKLGECDVVVNDLDLFNDNRTINIEKYFSKRLRNKQKIDINFLFDYNFMGMSNTATNTNTLNINLFPKNKNILAYDWFIWSQILLRKKKVIFYNKFTTKYRIHKNNVSALFGRIDEKEMLKVIKIKKEHYLELKSLNEKYNIYSSTLNHLEKKLKNPITKNEYIQLINSNINEFPFWWEKVTTKI